MTWTETAPLYFVLILRPSGERLCYDDVSSVEIRSVLCVCFWRNSPQWSRASSLTSFLDHTQRRTTVGRTPPDEWSARRRDLCLTSHNTHNRQTSIPPVDSKPQSEQASGRRPASYTARPLESACVSVGLINYTVAVHGSTFN